MVLADSTVKLRLRRPTGLLCTWRAVRWVGVRLLGQDNSGGVQRRHWHSEAAVATGGIRELLVVRHGETQWNAELRVQGTTDIPLNERGRLQAQQSAAALAREFGGARAPPVVHSSHLQRAVQTATSVAAALNASRWTEDNFVAPGQGSSKVTGEWDPC